MGWFGSIHVRAQSAEQVIAALRSLKQYDCYVGHSGPGWVGVYDKRNEEERGAKLATLSRDLSSALGEAVVLGFLQGEDGFGYWLYRGGQLLDHHPRPPITGLLFVRRAILDLCPTKKDTDRVLELLDPKRVVTPTTFRMTEEEIRDEIHRNKKKGRPTWAVPRSKMTDEHRKIYPTDRYAMEIISKVLGIEYFWVVYSDFSPYDLPPTFVHLDCFGR
jgi:hypothetical protein